MARTKGKKGSTKKQVKTMAYVNEENKVHCNVREEVVCPANLAECLICHAAIEDQSVTIEHIYRLAKAWKQLSNHLDSCQCGGCLVAGKVERSYRNTIQCLASDASA